MCLPGSERMRIARGNARMARGVLLLSIMGCLTYSTVFGQNPPAASAPASGPAPKWTCAEPVHQFEPVWAGDKVKHTFVFRNEGDATLRILGVHPGCRCTAANDYTKELAPGAEGQIPVVLDTHGMRSETVRAIRVETDDPRNKQVTLTLKGQIKTCLDYPNGQNIDFGRINAGSELLKAARVVNQTEQTMKLEPAEGKSGVFAWQVKEIEPGKVFDVYVTATPPFADGPNNVNLHLRTGLEREPNAQIFCRLHSPPVIECSPPMLMVSPTINKAYPRDIYVQYNGEGMMNLLGVEAENPTIKTSFTAVQPGKSYNLQVQLPANLQVSPDQPTHIILKTDLEDRSKVLIPIRSQAQARPITQRGGQEKPWSMLGQMAPRIVLPDLKGNQIDVGGASGKVTILYFGSTWCVSANQALRDWFPVLDQATARNVQFINVNTDVLTPTPEVAEWMAGLGVAAQTVQDRELQAVDLFGISRLPTVILIGGNGVVEVVRQGYMPNQSGTLEHELQMLAEGKTQKDLGQTDYRIGQFCAVSLAGRQNRMGIPVGMIMESYRVFAGWRTAGQPFNFRIYYRNEGDSPVRITGVEVPEGMEIVSDYVKDLQPRQVGVIQCVVTPPADTVGEFTQRLTLDVSDTQRPRQIVLVSGMVTSLLSIEPADGLDFIYDPRSLLTVRPATLIYNGKGTIQYGKVTSDSPSFEGRIEPIGQGTHARLIVETKPPYVAGETKGVIRVQTDHKDLPVVEVPVRLYVPPPVEVIPAKIEMFKGDEEREIMVFIANNTQEALQIKTVETSNNQIKAAYFPEADGVSYRLELTFAEGFICAKDGEKVVVKTDNKQIGDIVIPILVKEVNHKG